MQWFRPEHRWALTMPVRPARARMGCTLRWWTRCVPTAWPSGPPASVHRAPARSPQPAGPDKCWRTWRGITGRGGAAPWAARGLADFRPPRRQHQPDRTKTNRQPGVAARSGRGGERRPCRCWCWQWWGAAGEPARPLLPPARLSLGYDLTGRAMAHGVRPWSARPGPARSLGEGSAAQPRSLGVVRPQRCGRGVPSCAHGRGTMALWASRHRAKSAPSRASPRMR